MNSIIPIKRLFRVAAYTSTAIGLISVGPAFVVGVTLGKIHPGNFVLLKLLLYSLIGISLFVFFIWLINIAFLNYLGDRPLFSGKIKIRQVGSYLACLLLMTSIRLLANPYLSDPEKLDQIFNWKMREFGIQAGAFDYSPFTTWSFQLLIMVFVIVSINTVVLIIQELVMLNEKKTRIETENFQLKIKNMEAANLKLKQQLQPHFLFNSLNVLKTLIKKQPDQAETYLKRLSDFLRASVSFDSANMVKFEDELKLSMDYIEMQKIRFKNAIQYEIDIPESVHEGFLPLFSIQLLLENAIKHNAFTKDSPLFIKVSYRDSWIIVSNNIQQKTVMEPSSGMGLTNLSERYRILSGNEIDIQSTTSEFSVSIKILQHENSNH